MEPTGSPRKMSESQPNPLEDAADAAANASGETHSKSGNSSGTPKGATPDLSSLEDLKGTTLDGDTFEKLMDTVKGLAESAADQRVTAARKRWEKKVDEDMASGKLLTQEAFEARLKAYDEANERKSAARQQLVETLAEAGIPAKTSDAKYQKFTEAYKQGLDSGQWTAAILTTPAGVRTVLAAGGVIESSAKAGSSEEDARPKPPNLQEAPITARAKDGEQVELSEEQKRQIKMAQAIKNL